MSGRGRFPNLGIGGGAIQTRFGGKVRARSEGMARRQASAPVPQRLRWRQRAWGGDSSAALAG